MEPHTGSNGPGEGEGDEEGHGGGDKGLPAERPEGVEGSG